MTPVQHFFADLGVASITIIILLSFIAYWFRRLIKISNRMERLTDELHSLTQLIKETQNGDHKKEKAIPR